MLSFTFKPSSMGCGRLRCSFVSRSYCANSDTRLRAADRHSSERCAVVFGANDGEGVFTRLLTFTVSGAGVYGRDAVSVGRWRGSPLP